MALKITAATRTGGIGCQHYALTVEDGAYSGTAVVHLDDMLEWAGENPVGDWRIALAALWAAYRVRVSGATPASLLNVEIA